MRLRPVVALITLAFLGGSAIAADFTLTVLHNNDVHARVEPAKVRNTEYGGYARLATLVRRLRATEPNPILLSAGDVFQGTLYFNVYEGLADLAAMNAIGFQAMTVGNHEFDRGAKTLAEFARRAMFPLLAANLDVSGDASLKDLVRPSVIMIVGGQRIGIVGAITPELFSISSPGETIRLKPLVESIQGAVDDLTKQGVNKVILVTHIGYDDDLKLAPALQNVDAIIGGHSHTPLGNSAGPNLPVGRGPYPTVVKDRTGQDVPIVQAYQWGMQLGRLKLTFDEQGRVKKFEGMPIAVGSDILPDPAVEALIAAFAKPITAVGNQPVGDTKLGLAGERNPLLPERTIGNVIADAQVTELAGQGAVAAFMNEGGVRAPIEAGPITYGEALTVQPFTNTLVLMDLNGAQIKTMLEWGARGIPEYSGGLLHVSKGTQYTIDAARPVGDRVIEIMVANAPLDLTKTYRVVVNSFLSTGGDGHEVTKTSTGYRYDTGIVDVDALVNFLKANVPLDRQLEGRIKVINTATK